MDAANRSLSIVLQPERHRNSRPATGPSRTNYRLSGLVQVPVCGVTVYVALRCHGRAAGRTAGFLRHIKRSTSTLLGSLTYQEI